MKALAVWVVLSLASLAGAWVLLRADHEADIGTDDDGWSDATAAGYETGGIGWLLQEEAGP
jgi:hypothetical protein